MKLMTALSEVESRESCEVDEVQAMPGPDIPALMDSACSSTVLCLMHWRNYLNLFGGSVTNASCDMWCTHCGHLSGCFIL